MVTTDRFSIAHDHGVGLLAALGIMSLWSCSLVAGLGFVDVQWSNLWIVVPLIALIAFLYTGLFITAHDAMHGTLFPRNRTVNDALGHIAVIVFALFSYRMLREKHWLHHAHPATADDPDFHDGRHAGFVRWYLHFMLEYVTTWQITGMACIFGILWLVVGIPWPNVLLFWALPAILSSLQLFYFGTYLPHRQPTGGYTNRHRAVTIPFSRLVSFFTCYHFGRHHEHHEYPHIPWWRLGSIPFIHHSSASTSRHRDPS